MPKKHNAFKLILLVLIAASVIAAAYYGYMRYQQEQASDNAAPVLETMKSLLPGLGEETESSFTDGRDPLPVMTINDIDIVGCLEIPEIDVMAPVTVKGNDMQGFATVLEGSPVKGQFRLNGSRSGIFADLAKLKPGSKIIFTDMDGVRYTYSVLTQFHLKKWDSSDHDLMLAYKTDEDTSFIVGATRDM